VTIYISLFGLPIIDLTLLGGDVLNISAGGVASSTTVNNNASVTVLAAGSAEYSTVSNGGIITVLSGGHADFSTISAGGSVAVSGGGFSDFSTISNGGVEVINPGATASGTVFSGGWEYVSGTSTNAVISAGKEFVETDGTADFAVVSAMGELFVFSDAVASGAVLSGGYEFGFPGGQLLDTVVDSAGVVEVEDGALSIDTVVNSNGQATVFSGGVASDTTVSKGGFELVYGQESGAVISGGTQNVFSGGVASGTILRGIGARESVNSSGSAIGTIISSGGQEVVVSNGASGSVVNSGGMIDLPNLPFNGGGSAVVNTQTDVLSVTEGGGTYQQVLSGGYASNAFSASRDNVGGTLLTMTGGSAPPAPIPRTLQWNGSLEGSFANAGSWVDITDGLDPAQLAPTAVDTAQLLSGGGTIIGGDTVAALQFGGSSFWNLASGATLAAMSSITVGEVGVDGLLINSGAGVDGLGTSDEIGSVAGDSASVTVDGTGATWNSTGELVVGALGTAAMTVMGDAIVRAAAAGALPAIALGVSDGASGSLLVTGAGSRAHFTGQLDVGQAGTGVLTVANQATVATGDDPALDPAQGFDVAQLTGGSGDATVTGVGSLLMNTGRFVIGDQGIGRLLIAGGATVTTTPGNDSGLAGAVIADGAAAAGAAVDVAGAGSNWQVTGTLIDGNAGAGLLDIGPGASVSADVLELGLAAGGVGVLTMEGSLTTTGSLVVGGAGAGELSLLSGASVTIDGDLDIGGGSGSSGNVDVENTTGTLIIDGNLNVGVGGGVATMTIGLDTGVQLDNGGINQGKFSKVIAHTAFDPIFENSNGGGFVLATGTNTFLSYFNNNVSGQVTQDAAGDQSVLQVPTIYASAGSGSFQINSGDSALTLNADGVSGQTFQFTDNTGTLVIGIDQLKTIDVPSSGTGPFTAEANPNLGLHLIGGFGGTIASMVVGDAIVVDTTAQAHISYAGSGTVVAVIDNAAGTQVGTLAFASAALAAEMSIGSATASQLELVACFAAGTRIETAAGLVAVEDLRVGDEIRTVSERLGGDGEVAAPCEPIVWIGSRTVNCARHPNPETVWPVRVAAGAFGENVPERDLWLSPDHAVFVSGVLVPVKLLINGGSITQVKRTAVTYYHVELPEHAVILAEGLTVESYLDIGDRADFGDSGTIRLHPDFAARLAPDAAMLWETKAGAPLVLTGSELASVRRLVAHRSNIDPRAAAGRCLPRRARAGGGH
jgi:T5SS/PEP-CTERM-associated repeat protein/autotransporter passenger strand-loop-strand repeat protein